ncbi:MAG: type II secretion system protein [Candidatus Paceibacterota bacterium]
MRNKRQNNKAFTLIELMIATTLFTIIMMMGVGALVVSSNAAKVSQKLRIAVDNVNFAMESMTRELRMGTHYQCETIAVNLNIVSDDDCHLGEASGNIIAFTPQQTPGAPTRVSYQLVSRANGTKSLQRCEKGVTPCPEIVSDDVDINELKFYVKGADETTTGVQPSVIILIKGIVTVKNKNISKSFTLQTMTSQRSAEK